MSGWVLSLSWGMESCWTGVGTLLSLAWHWSDPAARAPYGTSVLASTLIGFSLSGIPAAFAIYAVIRHKNPALHGDARFARTREIRERGLLERTGNGMVIGRHKGKLLRLTGQQFAILAAPTRSGKGVGIVVPNLLEFQDSAVVLDIKQENFELTSGWRERQGQSVYLFNPFAEDRRTHRWNPLSYVSDDPAFRVSDLMSIASTLYPDVSDEQKFWVSQARNAFMAFALYLFDKRDAERSAGLPSLLCDTPTLGKIYRLSNGDGSELRNSLQKLAGRPGLSGAAQTAFAGLLSLADETFASVLGSFREPLNGWINPVVDAATSGDDFLLTDVRKRRMTIYIGILPNKLAESRLIVNLFFSQLIHQNTKELPQGNPELRHQCLLLMDEFTSIGKVAIIASAVSYMAGYNLRLLPIIQSMSQLDATYGKDAARTLVTNHAAQIVFTPREQQDAQDYSEMLGYTTVKKTNITRGRRRRDTSRSATEERRALMLPQELKALGVKKSMVFCEGLPHAIMCEKIRYYEDRHFTARLLPKTNLPSLQITPE